MRGARLKFKKFHLAAIPIITDAYCECKAALQEVSDGLLSRAMFCPKCENVYQLKLIKTERKRINKAFLEQCREEVKR